MNLQHMMKQAQALQKKMDDLQQELARSEVEGKAGGNLVTVIMTAKGVFKKVSVDKSLLIPEEVEVLEDLLLAALSDAKRKAEESANNLMGDLNLPPEMMKTII